MVPRMTAGKRSELESFWRAHLEGWRRSDLNQREYCELHGLPLKRFGNWRTKLKHEEPASAGKLLYRRGGGIRHMSSHMTKEIVPPPSGYIPSARSAPPGARRRFSEADKRRIVEESRRIRVGRRPAIWDNRAAAVPLEAGTGAGGEVRDDLPAGDDHGCTGTIGRDSPVPARARAGDRRAPRARDRG